MAVHSSRRIILEATENSFESQAVLNPGCIQLGAVTHFFYRAVRAGNYSSIGYCTLEDGEVSYRAAEPVLIPEFDYEHHGVEDPRISYIDGIFYLIYIAYDGKNARIAYATATELPHFTKQGIISPPMPYHEAAELFRHNQHHSALSFFHRHFQDNPACEDILVYEKDALLFPRKINGKFALVHRVFPEVQIAYFDNFSELATAEYWYKHLKELQSHTILKPAYWFENRHIGGGCVPIETEKGWLFLYHAVEEGNTGRTYHGAAALLDRDDPTKVIGRLPYPLFSPETRWERSGDVNNVVFPTGAVVHGDELCIYYGAADSRIAEYSVSLSALLTELLEPSPLVIVPELELAY
jgi:predicted GH43/DUF377 family glycosyl hydrolase